MRIAIDAMGGDHAPGEIVEGAIEAARDFGVSVILVGDREVLDKYLQARTTPTPPNVSVHHASQVVEMGEAPAQAIRRKRDSSVMVATRLHADGAADAVLSAGNTGAASAAAILALRPVEGVDRPGIATVFPTQKAPLVLMDAGANVDCRPRHLSEFAIMGAAYARAIHNVIPGTQSGVAEGGVPRVGLLSIGEEEGKGNELVKASYKLLREGESSGFYKYFGNVEGRDIAYGTVEVVVCDGFVGNVVLKVAEGFSKFFAGSLKDALLRDARSKLGALLLKPSLQKWKSRMDYTEYGGAVLLGVNGVCIICHGSAERKSIYSAIRIARQTVESDVTGMIRSAIAQVRAANEASDAALEGAEQA
jgi:glycerol-3-phosphate acyltransferase PlsX